MREKRKMFLFVTIVNDTTNFCFRLLPKPYTSAFARPKTKFFMSLTIRLERRREERTVSRVYNFSAGPAVLPEEVLKEAAAEMLDYKGSGMSVMK